MNNIISILINGISVGAVYALIAVGFSLVFSILKFSNFAHGGLMSVAAYIGYFFAAYFKTNFVLTIILTIVATGFVGLFVELIGFRRIRKSNSAIIFYFVSSITVGMLLESVLTLINGTNFFVYPKFFDSSSFEIFGFIVSRLDVIILGVSIAVLLILLFVIKKTKLGLSIRAVALDANISCLMGINTNMVVMATFFIAGSLAGISGVLLGISYTVYPQLGQLVVKGFIASVLGGLGSLDGAVYGAFLLGIVEVILIMLLGSTLSPVLLFAIMLVFLMIRPQGIAGTLISEKA